MSNQPFDPDTLAQQLDVLLPPNPSDEFHDLPEAEDPLLAAAVQVAAVSHPELEPEAMQRIQAQVLAAFEQQRIQQQASRFRASPVLRWALVAGLAFIILFATSVPAALASVPGDWLYPVKGVIEQVELGLANSAEARAAAYLTFAERRSQEAAALVGQGRFEATLVQAALAHLQQADESVRLSNLVSPALQTRAVGIKAQLENVLVQAVENPQIPIEVIAPAMTQVHATHEAGGLLPVPATSTHVPTEIFTETATPTLVPSETASPTATFTPVPSETASPTPSPAPTGTLTANFIIEGRVEAIEDNTIIIYGFPITLPSDDPLLTVIRVGDEVRVEGNLGEKIEAITILPLNDNMEINPDGQTIWRDSGDCSNPPPAWATATGWRARCGGQPAPGNQGGGNNNNRGGGNQGQGRGNNSDNDDDD